MRLLILFLLLPLRQLLQSDPAGFFMKEAGVKFNDGESFSAPGFIRVNFACPRAYLEEAFDKVEKALDNWKKQEKVY